MKKFLSSLLALTMILSLVIVPANATDASSTLTVSGTKPVEVGERTTLSVSVPTTVTVGGKTYTVKTTTPAPTATWTIADGSGDKVEFVDGAPTQIASP